MKSTILLDTKDCYLEKGLYLFFKFFFNNPKAKKPIHL
jgi:hypothetical protein